MRANLLTGATTLSFGSALLLAAACDYRAAHADDLLTSPLASEFGGGPWLDSLSISPDGSKVVALVTPASGGVRVDVIDVDTRTVEIRYERDSVVDGETLRACTWAKPGAIVCRQAEAGAGLAYWDASLLEINDDGSLRFVGWGELVNLLPDSPTDVLIRGRTPKMAESGLFRRNLESLASTTTSVVDILADESGQARIRRQSNASNSEWDVRPTRDADWVSRPRLEVTPQTRPLGMLERSNEVVFVAERGQRTEVMAYDLVTRRRRSVLADPSDNVVNVRLLGATRRPVGAEIFDGVDRALFFEPRVVEVQAMARRALNTAEFVDVVDEDFARRFYVVSAAGRYYRLDSRTETIIEIPFLPAAKRFAERAAVKYGVGEGREVRGHLSLPSDARRPLPTVIVPSLNTRVAQPQQLLVSFLVANGYAVFEAPYPSWLRRKSVDEPIRAVTELGLIAEALVEHGVAESSRICALGWEAGGLTALMAALENDTRLECVVAIAPVATSYISDGAKSLRAPLLVMYGSSDELADLVELPRLRRAVRAAGGSIEFVRYEDVSQALEEPAMRIDAFARTALFLEQHIGR